MENEVCFIVRGRKLYAEQILVEYNGIPIFFICIDDKGDRYAVLYINADKDEYLITSIELSDLVKMLHGEKTMRQCLCVWNNEYWYAIDNKIFPQPVIVDESVLPQEGAYFSTTAYFSITGGEITQYVQKIEKEVEKRKSLSAFPVVRSISAKND